MHQWLLLSSRPEQNTRQTVHCGTAQLSSILHTLPIYPPTPSQPLHPSPPASSPCPPPQPTLLTTSPLLPFPPAQAFASAIAALNTTAAALLNQTDLLTVFLGYHASTQVYDSEAALVAAGKVLTMANQTVTISSG
jgi:hypothetical protein